MDNSRAKKLIDRDISVDRFSLESRIMKVAEEYGELMEAYLVVNDPNSYKEKAPIDILEEAIDTYLTIFDVIYRTQLKYGYSEEDVDTLMNVKLDKWEYIQKREGYFK